MGKGAIAAGLVARTPGLWLSRSWTTRPRRVSDDADAYVFVDRPTFEAERDAGGFVEWAEVFGNLYGTPVPAPPPGADVLLEIDVQGAAQVKQLRPDTVVVCVRAPSRETQAQRLRKRGDDEEAIARRMALADAEEETGLALADHVVVNDDLDRAIEEAAGIVETHRSRRSRPSPQSSGAPVVVAGTVVATTPVSQESSSMSERASMIHPPIEDLLDKVDSKFSLVSLAAKRGRQINSYFSQLGEGLGAIVPPQVAVRVPQAPHHRPGRDRGQQDHLRPPRPRDRPPHRRPGPLGLRPYVMPRRGEVGER